MDYNDFEQQLINMDNGQASSSSSSNGQQSTSTAGDVDMARPTQDNDDDDMPALEPISGSYAPSTTVEVEMQPLADDPPVPELSSAPPRPNRRARVEDDDDEDRDRRHPSERINTPLPSFSMSPSPSRPDLASFLEFIVPPPPAGAAAPPASTASNPAAPAANNSGANTTPPAPGNIPEFITGGIAISFDFGPGPVGGGDIPAEGGAQVPPFPGLNADALREMFGLEPDVEDPERADRLIEGLEEVPVGLVKRLERVGGMIGANGEDLSGGDSGCAVCWEKLLDQEAEKDEDEETKPPKIVSLPCAHVFHADCLRPWFSRPKHTTCPTCRFNIDPEDLTYIPYSQRRRTQEQEQQQQATGPTAQPAQATAPSTTGEATSNPAPVTSTPTPVAPDFDGSRGRADPTPSQEPASSVPRRTSSEPPTGRTPRQGQQQQQQQPDSIQSFSVPGGHIIVVNHPLGSFTDAQGRPTGGEFYLQTQHLVLRLPAPVGADRRYIVPGQQQQTQEASSVPPPATTSTGAQSAPAAASNEAPPPPQPTSPPVQGGNPFINSFPRMTMPGGGQLPAGMMAFDIQLPFPLPFPPPGARPGPGPQQGPATAQTAPGAQQPQSIRPPGGGFAGINFGQGGPPPPDVSAVMRRLFAGFPMPVPPPTTAAASNTNSPPSASPTPPPATATSTPPGPSATAAPAPAPPSDGPTPAAQAPPMPDGQQPPPGIENLLRGYLNDPAVMFRLLMSAALSGAVPMGAMPGARPQSRTDPNAPKKQWSPPTAPGPTLRQRVETREREAGLRCYDVSCGVGPSDEDPFVAQTGDLSKRCSIQTKENGTVCSHTFHSSCLVSAERVALRGVDAAVVDGKVEVSCPVCRGAGVISKVDWDEGVQLLA